MAEVLGTVAATVQLAGTVKDIWEFYHHIKDAPKEIFQLKKSLEDLNSLLDVVTATFKASTAASLYAPQLDRTLDTIRLKIGKLSEATLLTEKSKSLKERLKWVLSHKSLAKEMTGHVESSKLSLSLVLQSMTQSV